MVAYMERPTTAKKQESAEAEQQAAEPLDIPHLPLALLFPENFTQGVLPIRDDYKSYSRQLSPEGYEGFHDGAFWILLSTIAARRCYADFGKPIYPSLYIIFAARTSLYAKTTTAMVVRDVLRATGLDWLLGHDRTTPEKLMSDMAGWIPNDYGKLSFDEQERLKLKLAMAGQLGWINDEFGKFVKGMMKESSTMAAYAELLLSFDGGMPRYSNATITRSSEPIIAPYLSMLGCMTISNVKGNAKEGAELWQDGFWPRCAFVCPPPDSYIDEPFKRGGIPVPSSIVAPLRSWHERLGSPKIDIEQEVDQKTGKPGAFTKTAIEERRETRITLSDPAYEAWKRYRSVLKSFIPQLGNEDLDGSYDRLPDKAIRVATLIASLLGEESISLQHWAIAQEVAEGWRMSLHQLYAQANKAKHKRLEPTLEDKILSTLATFKEKDAGPATARDIGRALHRDSKDLNGHLIALARDGVIVAMAGRQGSKYRLAEEADQQEQEG